MIPQQTPSNKKTTLSSSEASRVVEDQWLRYTRARDNGHTDYIDSAQRCSDFYRGEQWAPSDRMKLESEGRPALTINLVLSTVNAVLGEQAANSVEFRYTPKLEGTEHTPGVMTKLATAICDANNYEWLEGQVFSDGVIQDGRGFFDLRISFNDNLMGEVAIRSLDPTKVIIDPDASEYDPATWNEVFYTDWLSLDQIEDTYGKKKRQEIEAGFGQINTYGPDSVLWENSSNTFGEKDSLFNLFGMQSASQAENRTVKMVRVVERQHIRIQPCVEFVDLITGDTKPAPATWPDERIEMFALENQLGLIKRPRRKVRWTVTADHVLLHDDWSPYSTFTIIPYFLYFQRGKPFGLVRNLLSPQEQLNKLASQELHIINTTANSGWIMERNSLSGMTADDLRNQGAETGLVLEINPGKQPPEKIQPNKVPAGIERAALKSAEFIKTISGVNNAQLGFDNPEVSGVALKQKEMRGQVQLQVPLENLRLTRMLVGRKILELVQQYYTEERTFKVVTTGMGNATQPPTEQEQMYIINQQTSSGEIVNNITAGKYDLSLSVIPSRDSYNDQQFAEVLNLRNVGVMIPDDRVVEYSHLAHKSELAEEIRSLQGRGQLTEEQQQQEQFKQQIMQQLAMLEVQKAQAEVQKLTAEAQAKLATLDRNTPEYEIERERMDMEIQMARENLMLRRDLALLDAKVRSAGESVKVKKDLAVKGNELKVSLQQSREANQVAREKELISLEKEQMKLRHQSKGIDRTIRKD